MNKLTVSALATLVAIAGLSLPALAASESLVSTGDDDFDQALVLRQLESRGVEAVEAIEWSGRIRAQVVLADGSTAFQFFDVDTLAPIPARGGNSRVLSDLDVGVNAPAVEGPKSLVNGPNVKY